MHHAILDVHLGSRLQRSFVAVISADEEVWLALEDPQAIDRDEPCLIEEYIDLTRDMPACLFQRLSTGIHLQHCARGNSLERMGASFRGPESISQKCSLLSIMLTNRFIYSRKACCGG